MCFYKTGPICYSSYYCVEFTSRDETSCRGRKCGNGKRWLELLAVREKNRFRWYEVGLLLSRSEWWLVGWLHNVMCLSLLTMRIICITCGCWAQRDTSRVSAPSPIIQVPVQLIKTVRDREGNVLVS
jgi:hypothetical protein